MADTAEERLKRCNLFVKTFPERQIDVYAQDWGMDKEMFMLQGGTHADRNTVLEGLHAVNFLFLMTR